MDKAKLERLLGRKDLRIEELYDLLAVMGSSRDYGKWMLTAPIALDFELCRAEKADISLCCALLTAILREDHFSNGSFEERLASGAVEMLLTRMKKLAKEPLEQSPPWFSTEELWAEKCSQVPAEPGVYYVLLPDGEPHFCEDARGGYAPEELAERWKKSGGKCLYIGKVSAKSGGLRTRLLQYMRCGYAGAKNHRGGRSIWQIEQQSELRVSWQVCPQADEWERWMLKHYREVFDCYPMANRRG